MANNIKFNVDFNVKKGPLQNLRSELDAIKKMKVDDLIDVGSIDQATAKLEKVQNAARQVEAALEKAYNPTLGTVDLNKFNEEIKSTVGGLDKVQKIFSQIGQSGQNAFRNITTGILTTNKNLKESHQWLEKMSKTMANTVRWTITSNIINSITGSIQQAYNYTKNLDTSLNDIRIVTEKSADEMAEFAKQANKAAVALGQNTKAYTDAALIYYQQGLKEKDVEKRTQATLKAANVTGQSAKAVSEQLTAVWNGYKVQATEAEAYVDRLAAVAATTASDLEELSIGMSKVASAANTMGVDIDQLTAQLSTIISVTRESPESIGTALKTVYARMSDIEAGLDTETSLGEYTKQMQAMGINALDAAGKLRDVGSVVEEIGNKWNTLNRNQQVSLAQTVAGTRQYSRMMALFDNWDMYNEALQTSIKSQGTLQKQQDIYMESTEAHLAKLEARTEKLYNTLFSGEDINNLVDVLGVLVDGVNGFVNGLGGGVGALRTLGAFGLNTFHNQIARGLSTTIKNGLGVVKNLENQVALTKMLKELNLSSTQQEDPRFKEIISQMERLVQLRELLTEDEYNAAAAMVEQTAELYKQQDILTQEGDQIANIIKIFSDKKLTAEGVAGLTADELEEITKTLDDQAGSWSNISELIEKATQSTKEFNEANANKDLIKNNITLEESKSLIEKKLKENEKDLIEKNALLNQKKTIDLNSLSKEDKGLIKKDINELEKYINDLNNQQEKLKKQISTLDSSIIQNQEKSFQAEEILVKTSNDLLKNIKAIKKYDLEIDAIIPGLKPADQVKIQKAKQELDNFVSATSHSEEDIKRAAEALDIYTEIFGKSDQQIVNAKKQLEDYTARVKENQKAIEQHNKTFSQWIKGFNLTKIIGGFTSATNAIVQFNNALASLSQIGDVLDNDDLSTWEKFTAIAGSLLSTFYSIGATVSAVKEVAGVVKTFQKTSIKLTNEQTAATAANTVASAANAKAEQKIKKERAESSVVTEVNTKVIQKNTEAKITNAVVSQADSKESIDLDFSKGAKTGKLSKLFNKSSSFLKSKNGKLLSKGGAIAGTVAVGVKEYNRLDEEYNKEKKALEELNKIIKETSESFSKIQQIINKTTTSLSDYSSYYNELKELEFGTAEYNQTLAELNKTATQIIKLIPNIKYTFENGQIVIDEKEQERAKKEITNKELDLQRSSMLLSASQTMAENRKAIEQNAKDFSVITADSVARAMSRYGLIAANGAKAGGMVGRGIGSAIGGTVAAAADAVESTALTATTSGTGVVSYASMPASIATGAKTGGEVGSWVGKAVGAIAAVVGEYVSEAVTSGDFNPFDYDIQQDTLTTAIDIYNKNSTIFDVETVDELKQQIEKNSDLLGSAGEKLLNTSNEELSALIANNEKLSDLNDTIQANNVILKANAQSIGSNFLSSKGINLKNEEFFDRIAEDTGEFITKRTDELYESRYKDKGNFGGGMTDAEIQKRYAELMGWDPSLVEDKNNNIGKYQYTDEKGVLQTIEISDDVARRALAQNEAEKSADDFVFSMETSLQELIKGITDKDVISAMSMAKDGDVPSVKNLNSHQIDLLKEKIKSHDWTDELAQTLGYQTAKMLESAFDQAITNNNTQKTNFVESLKIKLPEKSLIELSQQKDMTVELLEKISTALTPLSLIDLTSSEN